MTDPATLGAPESAPIAEDPPIATVPPPAAPSPHGAKPGTCSEHGIELVPPSRLASWRYDDRRDPIVCPEPEHVDGGQERCTYCGRDLYRLGMRRGYSSRRVTCGETCRNYLWRFKQLTIAKSADAVKGAMKRRDRAGAGMVTCPVCSGRLRPVRGAIPAHLAPRYGADAAYGDCRGSGQIVTGL